MTPHVRRKVFQTPHDQMQFTLQRFLAGQVLTLFLNMRDALVKPGHSGLEFRFVDQPVGVAINETRNTLTQLAQLCLQGAAFLALALARGVLPPFEFLPHTLGMGQQRPDFVPHRQLQAIRAHLGMGTETLPAKALGVRPETAVVGVGTRAVLARTRAQRFAVEGIAAVLTLQQALQQIPGPTA